jgi:hypothetical protein
VLEWDWPDEQFEDASALLVIAGGTGTENMCKRAIGLQLPIIAVGATGGVAEIYWKKSRNEPDSFGIPAPLLPLLEDLGDRDRSPRELARSTARIARFITSDSTDAG